jgi:hypothetical protein
MKMCIIGFPRSRSSILLETISNFYKIPILGQDINQLLNTGNPLDSEQGDTLLTQCFEKKDGVIRLHPLQLMNKRKSYEFFNFDLLKFKQYDKIYFTSRSPTDAIASELVAHILKKHTYKSKNELFTNIHPIEITYKYHWIIKEYIYSENLVTNLKKYFEINNIDFQDLYYNDIPEYLNVNFPNTWISHVETKYNYQKIITNYSEILPWYNKLKESI